jgi:tRNA A22 N-methylase
MEMTRKKKNPRFTQKNDEQLREDYQVKFTDSFVALENLDDRGAIKTAGMGGGRGGGGGGKY